MSDPAPPVIRSCPLCGNPVLPISGLIKPYAIFHEAGCQWKIAVPYYLALRNVLNFVEFSAAPEPKRPR